MIATASFESSQCHVTIRFLPPFHFSASIRLRIIGIYIDWMADQVSLLLLDKDCLCSVLNTQNMIDYQIHQQLVVFSQLCRPQT